MTVGTIKARMFNIQLTRNGKLINTNRPTDKTLLPAKIVGQFRPNFNHDICHILVTEFHNLSDKLRDQKPFFFATE